MNYAIRLTESAKQDLQYFKATEQRTIVDAIKTHLHKDAEMESNHRKKLRLNPLAPWELKSGIYRVFYQIENSQEVIIVAVGYKNHNNLFIRGKKVQL